MKNLYLISDVLAFTKQITHYHFKKGGHEMKKRLLSLLLFVVVGLSAVQAHDFSVVVPSGQTLYFNVTSNTVPYEVEVTYPGSSSGYNGYSKPVGNLLIPATVTSNGITYYVSFIENYAFYSCSGLTSVTIPNSVTSIGEEAFRNCSGLTSVTIPNSVTSIGGRAFEYCSGLTSVTIPSSVTSIGILAFCNCSGLTSVTIPNSVTSIGNEAFYLVKNIIYNGTATGSPWEALSVNGYIEGDFVYANNTKTSLLAYIGTSTSVTIPNSVTSIGSSAFSGCSGLTSVTIPSSVTSIGSSAFEYCSGLTSVTIPNSVTSIGDWAFYNCSGLTSVTIPNSVSSIGSYAFRNVRHIIYNGTATGSPWGALSVNGYIEGDFVYNNNTKTSLRAYIGTDTNVTIPNSVSSIGSYAFYNCSGLTSVTIPNSVSSIGSYAFYNCSGLTSVTIPSSDTSIGNYAFYNCSGLTSVTIPSSVSFIGSYAFYNVRHIIYNGTATGSPWGALSVNGYIEGDFVYNNNTKTSLRAYIGTDTNVTIPNSVTYIGNYAFYNCDSLKYVEIPYSVNTVGTYAFQNCSRLNTVVWNSPTASLNHYNYNGNQPFQGCNSLRTFVFGDSVTRIPDYALRNLSTIKIIKIGNNVDTIEGIAFYGGNSLDTIISSAVLPPTLVTPIMEYNNYNTHVIVPCQSTSEYYSSVWNSYFTNIVGDAGLTNLQFVVNDDIYGSVSYNCSDNQALATPNWGYEFVQWSDGDTANPRTIPLVNDTTFTAIFDRATFSLNGNSSVVGRGIVNGTGNYLYLDTAIITAVANYGYHFAGWSDGDTNNPRNIQIYGDTNFTAIFDRNTYTLATSVSDSIRGIANGAGNYLYQNYATITATANYGYHFSRWSDNNTNNPRNVRILRDTSFTAIFDINTYTLSANTNIPNSGVITGIGNYLHSGIATITAVANYGYHFAGWSDGDTNNPRNIQIYGDTNFTAIFDRNTYTLATSVSDSIRGIANGAGNYLYQNYATITATANYGYHFSRWSDNNTNNPRNVRILRDTSFTAIFDKNTYTIVGSPNILDRGVVNGIGNYLYLDTTTITAVANYGYHFVSWSDGNTNNPRSVQVLRDTSFTAIFEKNLYTVISNVNISDRGSVSGSGTYQYLDTANITAVPNYGYHFIRWSDGNTDNPRNIVLLQDTSFTAIFDKNEYSIAGEVNVSERGYIEGMGIYLYKDTASVEAKANYGYHFEQWHDGNTDNPRYVEVLSDTTFNAYFARNVYSLTLASADNDMGFVEGAGDYEYQTEVMVIARPKSIYFFKQWSDGNTDNPRIVKMNSDTSFTAYFTDTYTGIETSEALDTLSFYPNPTNGIITFNRNDILKVEVLDVMGRVVAVYENEYVIDMSKLIKGYYTMRITIPEGVAVRKVVRK